MFNQEFLEKVKILTQDQLIELSAEIRRLQIEFLADLYNSLDGEDRIELINHARDIVSKRYTDWIEHEESEGEKDMVDKDDLAEEVSRQSKKIFSHLPPGEIEETEPLFFTVFEGRVIIAMPRGDSYWLEVDRAVRLHVDDTGAYITTFKDGVRYDPPGSKN